jgi:Co/Zn/Cd efflux system component
MDAFLALLGLFLLVIVFAWLARRLLGAQRVSTGKTLLAAVAGFVVAALIGEALRRARDLSNDTVLVVTAVLALVFTMLAIVILEALSQPGPRRGLPVPAIPSPQWETVTSIANRAILAFVGAALGVVSAMLFSIDSGPLLQRHIDLFDVLGFIGLFAGAALMLRAVLEVFRDRQP